VQSSRVSGRLLVVLMGALTIIGCFSAASMAADEVTIGVVDSQKMNKDAPRIKQYNEELDAFKQVLVGKMDIRSKNLMLKEDEIQELIDLKLKTAPTDKETARIAELEKAQKDRDAELKTLAETRDPDDAKKARLKELQDLQTASKNTGTKLSADYEQNLQTKADEVYAKLMVDIQSAIGAVAATKKITLVLDKAAVYIGGVDITDEVIAKLDRKVQ
jgi:Skp family chaperone for outer membrane proteins